MSWKMTSVDNGKKIYKLQRHCGHKVTVEIPAKHHAHIPAQAYLAAVQDAHDSVLGSWKTWVYPTLNILLSLTVVALIIMRHR